MPVEVLKKLLIPDEFVIDEPRVEVFHPSREFSQSLDNEDESQENQTQEEEDLVTEITNLMLEQARLEQRTKFLESGGGQEDEIAKFIKQSLPSIDNFWRVLELAREHPPSDDLKNWLSNVESIYFRLTKLYESYGLVFLNSVGKEVNLDCHEVIEYRPTTDYPNNYVIKEHERGVVFRNHLLRDAKVVVAFNPDS